MWICGGGNKIGKKRPLICSLTLYYPGYIRGEADINSYKNSLFHVNIIIGTYYSELSLSLCLPELQHGKNESSLEELFLLVWKQLL